MSGEGETPPNEEEREEREAGLDGMRAYGEKLNAARFQASALAKIIQGELEDIAARASHSLHDLLRRAKGDPTGHDAFRGRSRATLVAQALASLHGSGFGLVNSLVVITLEDDDDDQFCIEPVQGDNLLSLGLIGVMHRGGLLTDDVHAILTDGVDRGTSNFNPGDFVTNKPIVITRNMTATERLRARRASWCRVVQPRLPPGVELAEVIRVDNSDSSLRWRDAFDRTKAGWVEQNGVRKVATTRQSDVSDEDGAFWGFVCDD